MVTVKTTCPACGDIELTPEQMYVTGATYYFAHCGETHERTNAKAAAILTDLTGVLVVDPATFDLELAALL